MFSLNLDDYLMSCFPSYCPPGMTWDTFLTLRGTKGIYLDYTLKVIGWLWVVAHNTLNISLDLYLFFLKIRGQTYRQAHK